MIKRLGALAITILLSSSLWAQGAYTKAVDTGTISASGGIFTHINGIAELNIQAEYIISGSPTITSIILKGCMRGGTCSTLSTYTASSNTTVGVTGLYDSYQVIPTWTGGSNPSVQINWLASANSAPGATTGANSAQVQGATAPGAADASTTNPVQVAGIDINNFVRKLQVNPTGYLSLGGARNAVDGANNASGTNTQDDGGNPTYLQIFPYQFNGGTATGWDRTFYCSNTTTQTISAATTQLVALVSGKKIRICSYNITRTDSAAVVATLQFVEGTGAACVTGQTNTSGKVAAFASGAVGSVTWAGGNSGAMITSTAGDALCATEVGAASSMDVTITYATPF